MTTVCRSFQNTPYFSTGKNREILSRRKVKMLNASAFNESQECSTDNTNSISVWASQNSPFLIYMLNRGVRGPLLSLSWPMSSEFKSAFVGDVMVEMSRHLSASQFNVESFRACAKDKTTQGHHRFGKTTRRERSLFSIRKYIRYIAFKCGENSEFYIFM